MPKTSRLPIRFGVKWPDVDHGPWHVLFDFGDVDGRLECIGVAVRSFLETHTATEDRDVELRWRPGVGGFMALSAAELRKLPLKSLEREVRRKAGTALRWAADMHDTPPGRARELEVIAAELGASPRRWHTREHFEEVARIYSAARAAGNPAPTKAVAAELKATPAQAAKWVAKARNEMDLLPKTERGRPGGPARGSRRRSGTTRTEEMDPAAPAARVPRITGAAAAKTTRKGR